MLPSLAASALLGVLAADRGWVSVASCTAIALTAGCVAVSARRRVGTLAACALVVVGASAGARLATDLARSLDGAPGETFDAAVEGTVRARQRRWSGVRLELHDVRPVRFGALAPIPVPDRLAVSAIGDTPEAVWLAGLENGDRIRARLRIRPLGGLANPGARDRSRTARRRGIAAAARLVDARVAARAGGPGAPGLRVRLASRLRAAGEGGGLLAALALGDRSGLRPATRDAFRRLGISHLLAVSGLHLALVAALAFALVLRLGLRLSGLAAATDLRTWAGGAAVWAAVGYGWLSGWGLPVQRAVVFVAVAVLALAMRRTGAGLHALAAAALAIAWLDPAAVFELGAQLSFVATAALLSDAGAPAVGWRRGLRVSATAIAATVPVLGAHGVGSSAFGLVANSVAVPWTALVLLPLALVATLLAGLGWEGSLAGCAWLAASSLDVALAAAARLPAPVPAPVAPAGWLLAAGLGLAALRARATGRRVLLAALACGVPGLLPGGSGVGPGPPRVVALDVGRGDAVLVQGRHAAILVDAGWAGADGVDLGRSVVLPALRALGVTRLDAVVATHADLDHSGGVPAVLAALPVGEVWLPAGRRQEHAAVVAEAARRGVPVRERDAGSGAFARGDLAVEFLWPPRGRPSLPRNDGSLVLAVAVAGTRVLLTGDVGRATERALLASGADVRADVLKVAHHGSRGSSTPAFLEAVGAEVALLSAPCSTHGRLPSAELFERASRVATSVWWTGRDGALWLSLREGGVRRSVWGWRRDPHCRPRAGPAGPRRT